jgi:hypothetical protein
MVDFNDDRSSPERNLFKLMDGIIYQLNKTKKMFIIMILTVMILPPITLLISSLVFAPPYEDSGPVQKKMMPGEGRHYKFFNLRIVPLIISAVWLGIGIRQWFVLSEWTKKYERYKKLQEEVDKKLEDDDNNNGAQN